MVGKEGEGELGVALNTSGSPGRSGASASPKEQGWVGVAHLAALPDQPIRAGGAGEAGGSPAARPGGSWEPMGTRDGVRGQGQAGLPSGGAADYLPSLLCRRRSGVLRPPSPTLCLLLGFVCWPI